MALIDLTALAVAGIALTGAVLHFATPKAFMAAAGTPGIPVELALEDTTTKTAKAHASNTRFGGDRGEKNSDPAWASFPRAF